MDVALWEIGVETGLKISVQNNFEAQLVEVRLLVDLCVESVKAIYTESRLDMVRV